MNNFQQRAARMLMSASDEVDRAKPGTKDWSIKNAKYKGIIDGVWAMGCNFSAPFGIQMAVAEAMKEAGERPPFHFASNNNDFKEWLQTVQNLIISKVW